MLDKSSPLAKETKARNGITPAVKNRLQWFGTQQQKKKPGRRKKKKTHLWVVGKQHLANAAMSLDRKLYVCRSGKNSLKQAFSSSLHPRSHVTSGELRKPYSPSEVRGYLSYWVPMLVWGCCWLVLTTSPFIFLFLWLYSIGYTKHISEKLDLLILGIWSNRNSFIQTVSELNIWK